MSPARVAVGRRAGAEGMRSAASDGCPVHGADAVPVGLPSENQLVAAHCDQRYLDKPHRTEEHDISIGGAGVMMAGDLRGNDQNTARGLKIVLPIRLHHLMTGGPIV